jgi:CHAT domain-containing protein/tetratricopeptide (TPR) repeat protein
MRISLPLRFIGFPGLVVMASVLLVAFSTTALYFLFRKPSLDQLLVAAYSERRTLELRVSGAPYTPLPAERGPAVTSPPPTSLLEAEIRIQKEFGHHSEDPTWLAEKGRTELLAHNPDAAIQDLKTAVAISPGLVDARVDLASAYSERAGGPEDQPWDNAEAVELLTAVLREQPQNKVAIFNLALILERQRLFHEAAEQWRNYLKLDSSGGWAQEARAHLARDEREITSLTVQPHLLDGPEVAAATLSSPLAVDDILDQRAEDYLRDATAHWLVQAFARRPTASSALEYRSALATLARVLEVRHHDRWLSDLLSRMDERTFPNGISLLAQSITANQNGDYEQGARAAHSAATQFAHSGNRAGLFRSVLEEIYSERLSHNAVDCDRLGTRLAHQLANSGYEWAVVQTTLERQECLNMRGDLGHALSLSPTSLTISVLARYPQLYLRSAFFTADIEASLGNTKAAWRQTRDGLASSWNIASSPMRAYSFYTELDLLADRTNHRHFDEVVLQEALKTLGSDPDVLMRAMANHRLAQAALAAGDPQHAREHFQAAVALFSLASPTKVTSNRQIEARIGLARAQMEQKDFSAAVGGLSGLQNAIAQQSNYPLQVDFFQALGEANLRLNRFREADVALCSALQLTETSLLTLRTDSDRLEWDHSAGRTYRTLVESKLYQQDTLGALELWEWYRGAAVRATQVEPPLAATIGSSQSGFSASCPQHQLRSVRDTLASLSKETVISYAALPSGIATWAYDDRGVTFHWVTNDSLRTNQEIEQFTALCADPHSLKKTRVELGRNLYKQLLQGFASNFTLDRVLIFEPDDALWSIPFSALVGPDGRYLSEVSSISEFPGLYYRRLLRANHTFDRGGTVLAISQDRAIRFEGRDFPALPSAAIEVDAVAARIPHTTVLRNDDARLDILSTLIRQADVLHFAGHALQTGNGAVLLIGSAHEPFDSNSALDAGALASMHFPRLRLAVLSACTTEAGSDEKNTLDSGSLVRALMRGGVPQVIATRWPIDSASTSELMASFYDNLLKGCSVADALRLAIMHIRAQPATSHPYYWAGFTSFGFN